VGSKSKMGTKDAHLMLSTLEVECQRHGFTEQAERVSQRIRDLDEPVLVMVVGEGNFGKSTLINALMAKDVAPVSILPKTWKVDLYEPAQDKEGAWLYMRQNPGRPKKVSVAEAKRICEEEENKAKAMKDSGQSWKSDLFQVRWSLKADWPSGGAALVDTPGFSQLRADTSVYDIKLYGSNGIQLAASDAFEYYYYRADVVLWCINGNKLQDQDTLDALAKVHVQDKVIIGVITKMDRIPSERWQEIRDEAIRRFGRFISTFVCTAAGAKTDAKETTIAELKSVVGQHLLDRAAKTKSAMKYSREESGILVNNIDAIMECYEKNIRTRERLQASITHDIAKVFDTAIGEIEASWKSIESSAVSKLEGFYNRCDGNVDYFRQLVSENCLDEYEINNKISRILAATKERTEAETQVAVSKIVWDGVLIGGSRPAALRLSDASVVNASANFKASGVMNLSLTGGEGVGAGIAAGGVAAAVATFALGPIGLAAGLVGLLVGKLTKKSSCISEANSKIKQYCNSNKSPVLGTLQKSKMYYCDALKRHLETSFIAHHGKSHDQILKHIIDADSTINNVESLPSKTKHLIPLGIYGTFTFMNADGHKWSVYHHKNGAGDAWDNAVVEEWKQAIRPVLRRDLIEADGAPFHPEALQHMKATLLQQVLRSMRRQVTGSEWGSSENGLNVAVSTIVLESGAADEIRKRLPGAKQIIAGTRNKRLELLKHRRLKMADHFASNYDSSLQKLIHGFHCSVSIRLPRIAMAAMLAATAVVIVPRYLEPSWAKIMTLSSLIAIIWISYCNKFRADFVLHLHMVVCILLLLLGMRYGQEGFFSYAPLFPLLILLIYVAIAYSHLSIWAKETASDTFDRYISRLTDGSQELIRKGISL
jgi:GTPase Era involved in 16S rRNA processing